MRVQNENMPKPDQHNGKVSWWVPPPHTGAALLGDAAARSPDGMMMAGSHRLVRHDTIWDVQTMCW